MRWISLLVIPFTASCAVLDFGGDEKVPFEFRSFLTDGPRVGEEDPENPGFDKDGNKIPPQEVLATYQFPDIHAGLHAVMGKGPRITPTVSVELFEVKIPYARWFSVQASAGDQLVDVYLGKRLTSIFEVTVGPFYGWDFEERDWTWGVGGTIIKF